MSKQAQQELPVEILEVQEMVAPVEMLGLVVEAGHLPMVEEPQLV